MYAQSKASFDPARHTGWLDRIAMPHHGSGSKLVRKAMRGIVGLTKPRGPYAAISLHGIKTPKRRR